jgi:drug/metabolite transporter (DMT)-like permease
MSPRLSRLALLATAVLFSTGGAAIKATWFGPWQVACFRSAVAAIAVTALVPSSRRGWSWRVIPAGMAYAATLVLYVMAVKLTTAANAVFLQYTAPVYMLALGPLVLKERIRRSDLNFAGVVAVGLAMFFAGREHAVTTAPDPALGNILGAVSGIAWALTLVSLRWLGKHSSGPESGLASVVAGNIIAALVSLPMAFPAGSARLTDWAIIAGLGIFQIGLSYFLLTRAMLHVPAFEATTLLLVEPVLNPVWAWLIHNERPAAWALAGGALILAATFVHAWREGRTRAEPVDRPAGIEPRAG